MTPRYERWIESIGVPVHRTYYVQDLRTIEVGPWEERECNAAVVILEGNKDYMETRVTELPPAATLPTMKFSMDDIIYVLAGHGLTTIWAYEGGPKHTFEWQPHSLFFIPRNYTYQLSNAQGHEPARLLHYNYLPMAMSIIPEPEYFFDNPDLKPTVDIMGGEEHNLYSEARWVPGARRGGTGGWVASFYPDLMAFDKVHSHEGNALPNLSYCLPNTTTLRIGGRVLPSGTYKRAHYHGAGAVIVIPGGEGFSLMWSVFDKSGEKMFIPWQEGSMFGPPNLWYHQHMNVGPTETRYITLHPARHLEPDYEGSGIDFVDEDPWVRETFEAELAKRGVQSQMPPQLYTDPEFKWRAPRNA